jgi:hypothetical protein
MVALANAILSFSGDEMIAHVTKFARAILVQVLRGVNGILEIVSAAASSGIWRVFLIPRFGLAFVSVVAIAPWLLLVVARRAKGL